MKDGNNDKLEETRKKCAGKGGGSGSFTVMQIMKFWAGWGGVNGDDDDMTELEVASGRAGCYCCKLTWQLLLVMNKMMVKVDEGKDVEGRGWVR